MPFSLGALELLAVLAFALPTIFLVAFRGYGKSRWLIAASVCLVAAAIITPADLLTMVVLSVAFFALLVLGSSMRLFDKPTVSQT